MKVFDTYGRLLVSSGSSLGSLAPDNTTFTYFAGLTFYFGDIGSNIRIKNGKLQLLIDGLYYSIEGQTVNGQPVMGLDDTGEA